MFGLMGMCGSVGVDACGGVCVGVDAREGVSMCVGECDCSGMWIGVSAACIGEYICVRICESAETSCVFDCVWGVKS